MHSGLSPHSLKVFSPIVWLLVHDVMAFRSHPMSLPTFLASLLTVVAVPLLLPLLVKGWGLQFVCPNVLLSNSTKLSSVFLLSPFENYFLLSRLRIRERKLWFPAATGDSPKENRKYSSMRKAAISRVQCFECQWNNCIDAGITEVYFLNVHSQMLSDQDKRNWLQRHGICTHCKKRVNN